MVSNNSGTGNARVYRRVGALVRAGVPAFLLAKPLRAYTLTHSKMGESFFWATNKSARINLDDGGRITRIAFS